MVNPYKILGASESASAVEIRRLYRRVAAKCHPDRHGGSALAHHALLMVNDAYAALSTAERRAATDQRLALERLREKLKSAAFPQRRRPVQPRQRSGASRSRPAAASTSPPAHVAPASPPMPPLVQLAEAIAAQRPPSEQPWWILGAAILSID
jgi:curved DNA-binding protein CbpA